MVLEPGWPAHTGMKEAKGKVTEVAAAGGDAPSQSRGSEKEADHETWRKMPQGTWRPSQQGLFL